MPSDNDIDCDASRSILYRFAIHQWQARFSTWKQQQKQRHATSCWDVAFVLHILPAEAEHLLILASSVLCCSAPSPHCPIAAPVALCSDILSLWHICMITLTLVRWVQVIVGGGLMSSVLHSVADAGSNPLTGHSSSLKMPFTMCALHVSLEQWHWGCHECIRPSPGPSSDIWVSNWIRSWLWKQSRHRADAAVNKENNNYCLHWNYAQLSKWNAFDMRAPK